MLPFHQGQTRRDSPSSWSEPVGAGRPVRTPFSLRKGRVCGKPHRGARKPLCFLLPPPRPLFCYPGNPAPMIEMPRLPSLALFGLVGGVLSVSLPCQVPAPGEQPALTPPRITQGMITSGALNTRMVRRHGLRMFATPFNRLDGLGDGPMNPLDPTSPGGRPTLQNNGMFLRVNGLDSQTCMECHSILSAATVPFRFGIGGVGGANNNAIGGTTFIDVNDSRGNGFAATDARFINPPFLLGSGGVELVGKEMTQQLQGLKRRAQQNPGTRVRLVAKGVDFGVISYSQGVFITSGVVGINSDLVVRPFGRKGEFATTRAFDLAALQFHMGMQPVEVVGAGVDGDGDGVTDEAMIGEVSALAIFNTNLEPPVRAKGSALAERGQRLFGRIGCVDCHSNHSTNSVMLTYSFPEVEADPTANVYFASNLARKPAAFAPGLRGGISVPMFSDLKRHDMGPGLAETTGSPLDSFFVTARLWGVADTAPYLHDGRATTLTAAILAHGGDAQTQRDTFDALSGRDKNAVLSFLRTLTTPVSVAEDLTVGIDKTLGG